MFLEASRVWRPYHWLDRAAFLRGQRAGTRFSEGTRLDQHRPAAAHRRSAGAARDHRLLDLLL